MFTTPILISSYPVIFTPMKVPEQYIGLLPEDFDLDKIEYNEIGSFAQLLYEGGLVGYIILSDTPVFKPKGKYKG